MNIALMNQFVPPAHAPTGILLSDLADVLRDRGHSVTMVGSKDRYGRATGMFSKLREYISFYFDARRTLLQMDPPPDVVVSMTTPPFIGLAAAALKKKKGVPFILWCMDLYPEALAANGLLKEDGLLYRLFSWLTRAERATADCIVTLGSDMTRRVRAALPPAAIEEIPVWSRLQKTEAAETAARALRKERGWKDNEIICLYSGNMGRAHRVEEFAALAARAVPGLRFVFCGSGPMKEQWKKRSALFEWIEPVDEKGLEAHLLSADVHLISQQPDWVGVVMPSKYQAACAMGRPVLFAGPSESSISEWIRELSDGWILPPGDDAALDRVADEISEPMSVEGNRFDRSALVGRLADRVERTGEPRA